MLTILDNTNNPQLKMKIVDEPDGTQTLTIFHMLAKLDGYDEPLKVDMVFPNFELMEEVEIDTNGKLKEINLITEGE